MTPKADSLRIVVLGYVVRGPLGGMVWSNLQYLQGLAGLGHDVYFVEDSDDYASCYDPVRGFTDVDPTYGLNFASRVFASIGFEARWAYHDAHMKKWHGPRAADIVGICRDADLLLNLACVNPIRPWLREIPVRVYLDEDPLFNQIRHLTDATARARAEQHNVFFTFGENIAAGKSLVPEDGFAWQATRQPVWLPSIAASEGHPNGKFTTVMQWQSYPATEYGGRRYGMKADAFPDFAELPEKVGPVFRLAVGGAAPRELLRSKGWLIEDSLAITADPWSYERFIAESKAEFGLAKHGYVVSQTGWFSERSVCYLAHGRPVLAHDTGFSQWIRPQAGLVEFSSCAEAEEGVRRIDTEYDTHCRQARDVAAEYFDARKILPQLLEQAMNEPSRNGATVASITR